MPTRAPRIVLVLLTSAFLASCSSTNVIRSDYAPRVSAKSADIEQRVRAASLPPVRIAAVEDRRRAKDPTYADPKLVWVGRGSHSYRFGDKTVAEYLRESLAFDLIRLGFRLNDPDPKIDIVVRVNELRPVWDMGWSTVTPSYVYDYTFATNDGSSSQQTSSKNVRRELRGVAEMGGMSFERMTDELLNDRLAEFHLVVAEELLSALHN